MGWALHGTLQVESGLVLTAALQLLPLRGEPIPMLPVLILLIPLGGPSPTSYSAPSRRRKRAQEK